jgi:hypothetical protein
MLTLPNMVLAIPVCYLHPPEMVPRPSLPPKMEGIPMTIPILTPTIPSTPPLTNPPAIAGGKRKKKEPIAPLPLRVQPPCMLCEKYEHQTKLPIYTRVTKFDSTQSKSLNNHHSTSKRLQTKFSCAICSKYGHYTHHFLALPRFRQTLAIVCQSFQSNPSLATSSLPTITDIRYVTTSVNERMRCPFSLCESLDHFTYQCPMIIEYRQRQLTLLQRPIESIVDLTLSLEVLHVISPEPEALPMPPWFLDDLSEDSPPNPPNSPTHFPTEILHPTTTGTPQYFNIWFTTSEPSPSPCIIPPAYSSLGGSHMTTITDITLHDPLYSCHFHYDEEILKELNNPDYPWDALHHRALFFPQESSMPPNQHPIYVVEIKDFIPSGPIDWFKNPIPAPDSFEEGNMANISPTIKIAISIKNGVVEEITIGAACTPHEITTYKSLFQEYQDIFSWSYTEMPSLNPSIVDIASTHGLTLH